MGGVAGYGSTIENSRSFIEIDKGEAYVGAIAGDMEEDGTLTGNLFVHDTLGGLDGISYTGKAQPTTFDELSALGNAPGEFTQFQLTFMADGKQVAVIPFQYGQGIERLPDIPAKKGYSAQWPDLDYGHLTFSRTLEAEYTPYSSVITDGSGLPEILVDGSFSRNAKVEHATADVTWTDESGKEHTGTAYTVTVTDPVLDDVSYTVHYRLPDRSQRYALWVETKEGWQRPVPHRGRQLCHDPLPGAEDHLLRPGGGPRLAHLGRVRGRRGGPAGRRSPPAPPQTQEAVRQGPKGSDP